MGLLRSKVRFVAEDREMAPDIAAARELILSGELVHAVEQVTGELKRGRRLVSMRVVAVSQGVDVKEKADLVITNIGQLLTMGSCHGPGSRPKRGRDARDLGLIPRAALACGGGKVIAAGPIEEAEPAVAFEDAAVLDAGSGVVAGFGGPSPSI